MSEHSRPDTEEEPLSGFLCFALYSTSHAMNRVQKPLLTELGLTYPQFLVMVTLWGNDDQLVGNIGKALMLESNTLTPLLKRMETAGLVKRVRDETDERKVRVTLTAKGRLLRTKTKDIGQAILKATGLTLDSYQRLETEILALRKRLLESTQG